MTRILVVDDHELVRRGICSILATSSALTVCAEAVDGRDAVQKARAERPDIVVMDISMPNMNGLDAAREIKGILPQTEIVMVSQHDSAEMVRQAFKAGARGYIMKSAISSDLLSAIASVSIDQSFVRGALTNVNHDAHEILSRSAALEKALQDNEERLRLARMVMRVGTFEWNMRTDVNHWTPEMEAIYGLAPGTFPGTLLAWEHLIHPEDRETSMNEIRRAMSEGGLEKEWRVIWPDGSLHWILCRASVLKDATNEPERLIGVNIEITDRMEIERVSGLLAAIVDSSDDAIISKNLDGIITSWNQGAERIFGFTAQEAIGKSIALIIPPDRRDEERKILERLKNGERIDHYETVRMRKEGTRLNISLTISPVKDRSGRIIGASKVARDITEKKLYERTMRDNEERLRTLASSLESEVDKRTQELHLRNFEAIEQTVRVQELSDRLLQAQDEERRHIARELHDSAGQTLTVMGIHLARLIDTARQTAPEIVKDADDVHNLLQRLSQEIRTASYLLHPPLLDECGLALALDWYTQGLKERSGLKISLKIPRELGRLPSAVELAIFRIVQECLTNIHRHSGSKCAEIDITSSNDSILVQVKDRGKGISPKRLAEIQSSGKSVGIGGMRERMRLIHGSLKIESNGTGMTVQVKIPIPNSAKISVNHPS
jgi:PAS domain S-box-containing protein